MEASYQSSAERRVVLLDYRQMYRKMVTVDGRINAMASTGDEAQMMGDQHVRLESIGCAGIANEKHLPVLSRFDDVELVAFGDLMLGQAEKGRSHSGKSAATICTDYRDVLDDPTIAVIHVLTPNDSYSEIAIAAMEADKHGMPEKPMGKRRTWRERCWQRLSGPEEIDRRLQQSVPTG